MAQKRWEDRSPYDVLDRNRRRLGLTMLCSAILDVLLVLSLLLFPAQIATAMGLEVPQGTFHVQLWALAHLVFPCFGILAWMDPKRNVAIVAGAIVARVVYALLMLALVLGLGAAWMWAIPATVSLLIALAHYVFLRLSDFGFWEVFSRAGNPPGTSRS